MEEGEDKKPKRALSLFDETAAKARSAFETKHGRPAEKGELAARYDFDLAEFPWIRFGRPHRAHHKLEPIFYEDTITGAGGIKIPRRWKMYPSQMGQPFPGETTQRLFLALLHIWSESGFEGDRISFRTVSHLCHLMNGRNARGDDYRQIVRDIETLQGIAITAENAYYDPRTNSYDKVAAIRLLGRAVYSSRKPWGGDSQQAFQQELPFGYVMVSPELKEIAQSRAFFATGVPLDFLCKLPGQTARLAIHLSKYFISYPVYRRKLTDLCRVIPIEMTRPRDQRKRIAELAGQLLDAGYPGLQQPPKIYTNAEGEWVAEFVRRVRPPQRAAVKRLTVEQLRPQTRNLVEQILEAGGSKKDLAYWVMCVDALPEPLFFRGLSEAKLFCRENSTASFPKVLTSRFEDIAEEQGLIINPRRKTVKQ